MTCGPSIAAIGVVQTICASGANASNVQPRGARGATPIKYTDSAGEDGDRARKIAAIEQLDAFVPELRALSPDVIAVSGDHATPSQMAAHSWHPVPTIVWSERCGRDDVEQYGERWCRQGALGLRPTKDLMALLLANASRLQKYGA